MNYGFEDICIIVEETHQSGEPRFIQGQSGSAETLDLSMVFIELDENGALVDHSAYINSKHKIIQIEAQTNKGIKKISNENLKLFLSDSNTVLARTYSEKITMDNFNLATKEFVTTIVKEAKLILQAQNP